MKIAERIGIPVVVSSALETSIGIRAGLALAAALPELPFACGLNTVPLLAGDLAQSPLIAGDGWLHIRDVSVDPDRLAAWRAPPRVAEGWNARLRQARHVLSKASA
jgi:O-succinylbenzoate synthase